MSAAVSSSSSSIISIANSSNSALFNSKSFLLQNPIISIAKSHFTTPKLALKFKPNYYNISPFFRFSVLSPNSSAFDGVVPDVDNTESESSEIDEQIEEDVSDDDEETQSDSPEAGRLYVGNLPYAITSSELSQLFGEAGNVVSVEIVYDRVTDRSRGFAFVTMASFQEAEEAIRMFNGSQVGGRTVRVNFPEVPRGGEREVMGPKIRSSNKAFIESPHKIYAGNLSWIISSEKLKEAFANQPGLLSAKVLYERHSGRSRGFGFVTFESPEAAQSALSAMNGVEVEGRPLRLNMAAERADTSRPARTSEISVDESEILSSVTT